MRGNGNEVAPTSTAMQARVVLYQPSQRPEPRTGEWVETAFGRCKVAGRLGQRHADLVESILFCAEGGRGVNDGGVELLVDPARVRRTISDNRYSLKQIEVLLAELRAAVITIEAQHLGTPIIGGLIDHVIPSTLTRADPLTRGERHLWRVRLGVALVMLMERDRKLHYDPAPIARLQHGISQAVARHVKSHKTQPLGGWHVDTLIDAVWGKQVSKKDRRNAHARLLKDVEGLKAAGVWVEGGRVTKHRDRA